MFQAMILRNHRPKHVDLIGIINKPLLSKSSWLSILFASMMHGQTNIKVTVMFIFLYPLNTQNNSPT
jgi:hypothetical protein